MVTILRLMDKPIPEPQRFVVKNAKCKNAKMQKMGGHRHD
jgi:hypothetical protein